MTSSRSGALTLPRLALLTFGVMMGASAALLIKAATLPPALLAASRLLGAVAVLVPFWWLERRRLGGSLWKSLRPSLFPGVILGLHFIAWNAGARATLAGNATLVVNMVPLVMPFLSWHLVKEAPTRREIAGTVIALTGLALLAWGDYRFSPEHLIGDGLCFLAMVIYAVYLLMARRRAKPEAMFTYLTPLYASGAVVCLAWSTAFEQPWASWSGLDYLLVAGLVLGPTLAGHSIANWAMTVLRAQTVSLINLTQFGFAGLLAFFVFGEVPHGLFFVTAVLVVVGAGVALYPFKTLRGAGRPTGR